MDRETAGASKQFGKAETAIIQEQENMTNAEKAQLTIRKSDRMFEEMLNAIGDSLSNLACSDNEEDGEYKIDNYDDTELGMLSNNGQPGWVKGTIATTVLHRLESVL